MDRRGPAVKPVRQTEICCQCSFCLSCARQALHCPADRMAAGRQAVLSLVMCRVDHVSLDSP